MGELDAGGEPAGPVWSASAVARRLGVAPATLRSWNQRYQLGPAGHQRGRHRRYSEQDVAVLETMCRLVADGVIPAAAARIARSEPPTSPPTPDDDIDVDGAHGSRVEGAGRVALGLVQAALRLDAESLTRTLDHHLRTHGLTATWNQVCVPALSALGRRVTPAGDCVDAEHLLSWTIVAGLHRTTSFAVPISQRRVLLACADGERHSLGLEALHAALAASGIPARMLGASVPATVLAAAATRIRPAAVVVWAQVSRTARPGGLRLLDPTARRIIAAGPGWRLARLPPDVVRVDSLATAVELIHDAVTINAAPRATSGS